MDFMQLIREQQQQLTSNNYLEVLFYELNEDEEADSPDANEEDEYTYKDHIPLDIKNFVTECLIKLRQVKIGIAQLDWNTLDSKYIVTLMYYLLRNKDYCVETRLHVAHLFLLLNSLHNYDVYFYKQIYVHVLKVLEQCLKVETTHRAIVFVLNDLKVFLDKHTLNERLYRNTAALLNRYSFFAGKVFENADDRNDKNNIGYIAFACLKVIVNKPEGCRVSDVLTCLMFSLMSRYEGHSSDVLATHQKNVSLFIKNNMEVFTRPEDFLFQTMRNVCLDKQFDDYEGFARFVQDIPPELNRKFMTEFCTMMLNKTVEVRCATLDYAIPFWKHEAEYKNEDEKHEEFCRIFMHVRSMLCDPDRQIKEKALGVLANSYNHSRVEKMLKDIIAEPHRKRKFCSDANQIVDKSWSNKTVNTDYIKLLCHLISMSVDTAEIIILNDFREVCISAAPYDLRSCSKQFTSVLKAHSKVHTISMYILDIIVKMMQHSQATSSIFVKEFYGFIFTNLNRPFIWDIINYLSHRYFDLFKIVGQFASEGYLSRKNVKDLMEEKIFNSSFQIPALKLLCALLHHIEYNDTHFLDMQVKQWVQCCSSSLDINYIIPVLIKIIEKKIPGRLKNYEIQMYIETRQYIHNALDAQAFSCNGIKHVIVLLSEYSRVLQDDPHWDIVLFERFDVYLRRTLLAVYNEQEVNHEVLTVYVVYICELIKLRPMILSRLAVTPVKRIIALRGHSHELSDYLVRNKEVLLAVVNLYAQTAVFSIDWMTDCVASLEKLFPLTRDCPLVRINIVNSMFDVCKQNLQYYDPVIPMLFTALNDSDSYVRYNCQNIVIELLKDDHLRLADAQYFIFMGLFADGNDLIVRHMEKYIDAKFFKQFHQTIARHFVPSIIHYNQYIGHPTISLTTPERELLKLKLYTFDDRCCIYHSLLKDIPLAVKNRILRHIDVEILVRILDGSLPNTPEIFEILQDALAVILIRFPKLEVVHDYSKYYEEMMGNIEKKLSENHQVNESSQEEFAAILRTMLKSLFDLLYSDFQNTPKNCFSLLYTILVVTEIFGELLISSSSLKGCYDELLPFYRRIQDHTLDFVDPVNPFRVTKINKRHSIEFYVTDMKFSFIGEATVMSYDSNIDLVRARQMRIESFSNG